MFNDSILVFDLLYADGATVYCLQTEALRSICEGLHQVLQSPLLSAGCEDFGKMEIDEEFQASPSVQVQFSITVWDFVLPITPSLPAVFGVSLIFFSDISRYKDFPAYF